jgi:hypothetical protein
MSGGHDQTSEFVAEASEHAWGSADGTDPASLPAEDFTAADPLSDLLRTVKLAGALFFLVDATSPWCVDIPQADEFAEILLPRARSIISSRIMSSSGDQALSAFRALNSSHLRRATSSSFRMATHTGWRARPSVKSVCANASFEQIAAGAAFQEIAACAAIERVRSVATINAVVQITANQRVVTTPAGQIIHAATAIQVKRRAAPTSRAAAWPQSSDKHEVAHT